MPETSPVVALVGPPNSGKTTLFNALTGLRQRVANYPGVTVEKKLGSLGGPAPVSILDLPGLHSLETQTPDEAVTQDVLMGRASHTPRPQALLLVLDGSALERSLALAGSLLGLGMKTAAIVTMVDEIKARGGRLDPAALSRALGIPVVGLVGHRGVGLDEARRLVEGWSGWPVPPPPALNGPASRYAWAARALRRALPSPLKDDTLTARIDRVVLHPVAGPLILAGVMAAFFQAIFSWAQPAMDFLSGCFSTAGGWAGSLMPAGLPRALVVNGLFEGAGSVAAFLPQILILFFLLFLLEDIGYMARAAFLMDRLMGWAGLQGRCFVALVSSIACAIPGIMATRAIPSPQDRLATILASPLMTCSARLPVYALLIGAFIPDRPVLGPLRSQGLALLGLYATGGLSAFLAAWALRSSLLKGDMSPFTMDLPPYRLPCLKSVLLGMRERARLFLTRAGGIILAASLAMCVLLNVPRIEAPAGATQAQAGALQLSGSLAGRLGRFLEPATRPVGFDWRVNVGLLASLPAREIVVATLSQIYAVEAGEGGGGLRRALREARDPATGRPLLPLPAALSLLAFFVYALQCLSTLAVMRRETNGWSWPAAAFAGMLALAYGASWVAYRGALALGL